MPSMMREHHGGCAALPWIWKLGRDHRWDHRPKVGLSIWLKFQAAADRASLQTQLLFNITRAEDGPLCSLNRAGLSEMVSGTDTPSSLC